jgi:hypothetical protein
MGRKPDPAVAKKIKINESKERGDELEQKPK